MSTNKVGNRAIGVSLAVSLVFLTVFSLALFFFEYRREYAVVENEIQNLCNVQTFGVSEGLENHDDKLLRAMATGIGLHPYVRYVSIEDDAGVVAESGDKEGRSTAKEYRLRRTLPDQTVQELGWLRVATDKARIMSDVTDQVLTFLAFQALYLIATYLAILYFFSRMITRHLTRMADYIQKVGVQSSAPELVLDKRDHGDELDTLVRSFNAMRKDLQAAHEAEAHAMEELRLSEETNRILVEEAPDAILMMDYDTMRFISCNRKAEELFRRSREELILAKDSEFYTPIQPDGLSLKESAARATKRAINGETVLVRRTILRPDGKTLTCEARISPLPAVGRTLFRVSYLDITDRVRAEEEAARSLREKEVLLQEVYHRTKNNMQLIAAFLRMESVACGDERATGILEDMIGRITTMALVHQKLYQSEDLSRIDLGEYLEDLVRGIRLAHLSKRPEVRIEVKAQRGIVSLLDVAIPCGLALNELIMNAVKHAYPENRAGVIRVELFEGNPETLTFSVSDDGVGFPPGFDSRKDGKIGLQTVISLIEGQLHGSVSFGPGPGVSCTAVVRANLYPHKT